MGNILKKIQHVLYIVMRIYYEFHNSILIVQFERIIINFISIISLQIVQCLSHTLFENGTIPHFIWIWWANATNLKGFFDHLLILNKIVKSFLYQFNPMFTCWYWEFKTGITICIGKNFNSTCNMFYPNLPNMTFNDLLRLTSLDWHFKVQSAGIGQISELFSNNWTLTPSVK